MALLLLCFATYASAASFDVPVSALAPESASLVLPRNFMSFSIESSSFPDYAGNDTHPNRFTKNLVENIARETHEPPIIRVGGATAERSIFVPDQKEALIPFWDYEYNQDQPKNMTIGPAYWQSLTQLQFTARFVFNLNFAKNDSSYIENMLGCIRETFKQVDPDKIGVWEIGNEADQSVGHSTRPADWNIDDYAAEWLNRSRAVNEAYHDKLRFMAPSFAALNGDFHPSWLWEEGGPKMNQDGWITEVSQHFYMAGASNNPTLQGTLMNHTKIQNAANRALEWGQENFEAGRTYVMSETNSIFGQGAVDVSDVFGAALWEVDYGLWMASNNVYRLHFHQGTSYRYASWLPIKVNDTEPHVRPPYYGNIFLARFIGPSGKTRVANIPLDDDVSSAYAAYDDGKLARLAFLNLAEYRDNADGETEHPRPHTEFSFPAPRGKTKARVAKLRAPEAISTTGITIDGFEYSYQNGKGRPVRVKHDAETVKAKKGVFTVSMEASGAVMVTFL